MTKIKFQAYIPKSLGKSLNNYFKHLEIFNARDIVNFSEFENWLSYQDSHSYKWIPEPIIGSLTKTFFATDNCEFHEYHHDHSVRLSIIGDLKSFTAGEYSHFDINHAFQDNCQGYLNYNHQHSGLSHKVKAYIIENGSGSRYSKSFKAVFNTYEPKVSPENPLKITYKNTESGHNLWTTGSQRKVLDTTIIDISASAGYPYLEMSPNIDFDLKITINKNGAIRVEGNHNRFPAYELLINDQVVYRYNPADYGFTGPDPYNLNSSKSFSYLGR